MSHKNGRGEVAIVNVKKCCGHGQAMSLSWAIGSHQTPLQATMVYLIHWFCTYMHLISKEKFQMNSKDIVHKIVK